ncbi:MAG: DUF721 domain-containing protein [Spirochaetaceae bacterium]|jgi:hypothetical protein|nr:DUF721 domain-containing protein [Spirochaetaceae bacterium]
MVRISDLIDLVLKNSDTKERSDLYSSWPHIVHEVFFDGGNLASKDVVLNMIKNSSVREIKNNILIVETNHSGWGQILSTKHHELLTVIQERFCNVAITDVVFVLAKNKSI